MFRVTMCHAGYAVLCRVMARLPHYAMLYQHRPVIICLLEPHTYGGGVAQAIHTLALGLYPRSGMKQVPPATP